MTKEYSVLQKRFQELESELQIALSLPKETPLSDNIKHKFVFLKNLLSAESESHSHPEKPQHLNHIAKRVEELEAACHDREFTASSLNNYLVSDSTTCSPTESCFNNCGEDVYEDIEPEPEPEPEPGKSFNALFEDKDSALGVVKVLQSEEKGRNMIISEHAGADLDSDEDGEDVYEDSDSDSETDTDTEAETIKRCNYGLLEEKDISSLVERQEEKEGNRICKYVGAVFCGGVFGAAIMCYVMVRFSGCYSQVEHLGHVAPT